MGIYRVGFYYEEGGYTDVEADSEEEAKKIVEEQLYSDGLTGFDFDVQNREYGAIDVWKKDK